MKICTYKVQTGPLTQRRLGILQKDAVVDPALVWAAHYRKEGRYNAEERGEHKTPSSLYRLLNTCDSPIELLRETLELNSKLQNAGEVPATNAKLCAPLDKINVYRDCYTHEKHVAAGFKKRNAEIPKEWYEIPAYYKGPTSGFIGPDEEILWPHYSNVLDYELELAMVVGKEGKNIKAKNACKHIFGFTILNDISARDMQKKETAIRLGPAKGKDFCSVIGPVITTMDEFNYKEPDLLMEAFINDERWSKGQSGDAHHSWSRILEHTSMDEWVLPGDLFGSGTVGTGCGLEHGKWIKPGDTVELKVESIGSLINKVGQKR